MKMNKKKIIIFIIMLIIIIIGIVYFIYNKRKNEKYENADKNQLAYQKEVTIEDLMNDVSITGDSSLYEIGQEYDGRKTLVVKPSIKYKVAFAGMIKKSQPSMDELDKILDENSPKESGVWVEESSREKVLEILNAIDNKYKINSEGYLNIYTDKQVILSVSSVCYIVDDVTGEILDYNFEKMDKEQAYEYFEDGNKKIIFITENKQDQLTNKEIFESIIEIIKFKT